MLNKVKIGHQSRVQTDKPTPHMHGVPTFATPTELKLACS